MKNVKLLLVAIAFIASNTLLAQGVSVNNDGSDADPSAMLDVKSSSKGFLLPRMTLSEIVAISNPADGLMVINTDDKSLYIYNSTAGEWKEIAIGSGTITPWTSGDDLVDSRDGKVYATVQIGTQCWMAENLNIGTEISSSSSEQTDNSSIEKYCYENSTANCDIYGGLYQWDEMMQYVTTEGTQGICPTGWHLPSDAEWKTMEMYLGMSQAEADIEEWRGNNNEGGKLKETGTTHWTSPNTDATNSSGFTALPGGFQDSGNDSYHYLTELGYFWSSSEKDETKTWDRVMRYQDGKVALHSYDRAASFSVRCVKD